MAKEKCQCPSNGRRHQVWSNIPHEKKKVMEHSFYPRSEQKKNGNPSPPRRNTSPQKVKIAMAIVVQEEAISREVHFLSFLHQKESWSQIRRILHFLSST
ncbi:hypothetical protein JTE90_023158 [Oedothorax gibbosus]|uniref:Uncharacterized protein n=1 Tax=Oedothorax gibbosus TaxID=931172 RepID=A0AAV6UPR0_9ARAC|nr:hypothetical protein JTE90_023158 [Oedothorax gibbosus]